MSRPSGTKNKMKSPEEKEKIVLEYLKGKISSRAIADKYDIARGLFSEWLKRYREKGIKGFESKQGKHHNAGKYNRHKTEIEKLEEKLLKKEIELMRLKKGYVVKGAGAKKEYVSILDVNTK